MPGDSSIRQTPVREIPLGITLRLTFHGHTRCLGGVEFSADGATLATASFDRTVRLHDAGAGAPLRTLRGAGQGVRSVALACGRVAGGCDDGRIVVWDAKSGDIAATLEGHTGPVMSLAFAGPFLLSASQDRTGRVWDLAGGTELRGVTLSDWSCAVAASPDGALAASACDDASVRLWSPATGRVERVFKGHRGWVRGVAFSPDGRVVASGAFDRTVRFWEASSGRLLQTLELDTRPVRSVGFSSDGALFAAGAGDGVRVWSVGTWDFVADLPAHGFRFRPGTREIAIHEEDLPTLRLLDLAGIAIETLPIVAPVPGPDAAAPAPAPPTTARFETRARGAEPLVSWTGGDRAMLAVVFTDIVDSSALGVELGEERMGSLRREHFGLVREIIRARRGREVKTIGDSFMALFRTAVDALDFARDLQGRSVGKALQVRIGIHVGPVQIAEEDAFGSTVNYAARVEAQARGGEVWLSDRAKADVDGEAAERHRALAWQSQPGCALKGFPGEQTLWSVSLG